MNNDQEKDRSAKKLHFDMEIISFSRERKESIHSVDRLSTMDMEPLALFSLSFFDIRSMASDDH